MNRAELEERPVPVVNEQRPKASGYVSTGERKPEDPAEEIGPLVPTDAAQDFRSRWDRIQTTFVDDPRTAVQQADELLSTAMKRISSGFTEARNSLETQWSRGDQVSTEDLRVVLRKYRAFFNRLLAV